MKSYFRHTTFILVVHLVSSFTKVSGQETNKYSLSARTHYGYVMTHRPYMAIFNDGHVPSIELSFARKLNGKHAWENEFLNPELGISVMALELGNKELLGKGIGLCWFFNFPLIDSKKIKYSLKVGQGLGWIEKRFNYETNYKNFANSTAINGYVYFNNSISIPVTPQFMPSLGLSFTHFSNGAFRKPNLGLNIPAVNFGFEYLIGKTTLNKNPLPSQKKAGEREYYLSLVGSKKERRPLASKKYPVVVLKIATTKSKNLKSYWGYGIDFFYDSSTKKDIESETEAERPVSFIETCQLGLHLDYMLRVGNVYYVVQQGFYAYSLDKEEGFLYHRIGTRYHLAKRLLLNVTLKTHFAVADHLEFGLSYQLK